MRNSKWRSRQNSLRQSAGGFCWLEGGATGYGCFRGAAGVAGKQIKIACAGKSGRSFQSQTGALETLESNQGKEPQIRTHDERCHIHR